MISDIDCAHLSAPDPALAKHIGHLHSMIWSAATSMVLGTEMFSALISRHERTALRVWMVPRDKRHAAGSDWLTAVGENLR
jgi:hypothetical protein